MNSNSLQQQQALQLVQMIAKRPLMFQSCLQAAQRMITALATIVLSRHRSCSSIEALGDVVEMTKVVTADVQTGAGVPVNLCDERHQPCVQRTADALSRHTDLLLQQLQLQGIAIPADPDPHRTLVEKRKSRTTE